MKTPNLVYVRAPSLEDAFRLKAAHGADARWLAGGQSLLAALAFRLSEPSALIDISRLEALQGISLRDGVLRIGAGTTHTALGRSAMVQTHVPLLALAVAKIAHVAIRNRGTIGGSLAFADPAAELPACCVALDAVIIIASATAERRVAARDFFYGVYETALAADELIIAIEIRARQPGERQVLEEITRRSGDYAMAGVAVVLRGATDVVSHARLVFFALGDRPVLADAAGQGLVGQTLNRAQIELAAKTAVAILDPPGDLHGGPETKRHFGNVVLTRALRSFLTTTAQSHT